MKVELLRSQMKGGRYDGRNEMDEPCWGVNSNHYATVGQSFKPLNILTTVAPLIVKEGVEVKGVREFLALLAWRE